jgi:hypothetical protein
VRHSGGQRLAGRYRASLAICGDSKRFLGWLHAAWEPRIAVKPAHSLEDALEQSRELAPLAGTDILP